MLATYPWQCCQYLAEYSFDGFLAEQNKVEKADGCIGKMAGIWQGRGGKKRMPAPCRHTGFKARGQDLLASYLLAVLEPKNG